jgi:DNA-binding SARP family transcriptional activator
LRFEVLGPLRVQDNGCPIRVGGPREQKVLAALLLSGRYPLSPQRLISAMWAGEPPVTAKAQIHNSIATLRRALGCAVEIDRSGDGFVLGTDGHEVDVIEFGEHLARADLTTDPAAAAQHLRAGLALWRGPALSGLAEGYVATEVLRLEELRLDCLQRCLDLDLEHGRHAEVIAELRPLVAEYPLRERLHAQLMIALHRAGRRGEALAVYRQLHRVLADELGLEPDPVTQQLHRQLLHGAVPRPRPGQPVAALAQLPPDITDFVARADALDQLGRQLQRPAPATNLMLITGAAGVGKTALAVHWTHQVARRFPDGQLYADLRGYHTAAPSRPIEVLARFLRALGIPSGDVPVDLDAAAAQYRSLLADRRVLVVLDNAASAEQVRPLRPGGGACLTVVTSRDDLDGLVALDGARRLDLDVFSTDEATALVARIVGTARTVAEPAATAELARRCGHLPLALRIAAAHLVRRPERTIGEYVAELGPGEELAALRIAGDDRADVRAAFDQSYRPLHPRAKRVFRLLSLVPGPDFTAAAAAALTADPTAPTSAADARSDRGEQVLDELAAANLIQRRQAGRFAFHDLLRCYAAERATAEETPAARQAATRRLLDWYLHNADRAAHLIYPDMRRLPHAAPPDTVQAPITGRETALAWLHGEYLNLVAAITHTAQHGPYEFAYLLADALRGYFWMHNHIPEWLAAGQAGLQAARHIGDREAEAAMHNTLGGASRAVGDYPAALAHYRHALAAERAIAAREAQADTLARTALVHWEQGELDDAEHDLARALALHRSLDDDTGQARTLDNLACLHYERGHLHQAITHDTEALTIFRKLHARSDEANTLSNLAQFHQELGHLDQAFDLLGQVRALQEHVRSRDSEASILDALAATHRDAGHHDQALRYARQCLALAESAGLCRATIEAHNTIGTVYAAAGDFQRAIDHHATATSTAQEIGYRRGEIQGLTGKATGHHGVNLLDEAADEARHALHLARKNGYRLLEGRAQTVLADIALALGRPQAAIENCRASLSTHQDTGHRLGQAHTLRTLANALHAIGEHDQAAIQQLEADALFTTIRSTRA